MDKGSAKLESAKFPNAYIAFKPNKSIKIGKGGKMCILGFWRSTIKMVPIVQQVQQVQQVVHHVVHQQVVPQPIPQPIVRPAVIRQQPQHHQPALPVTRKFLFERFILTTTLYQIYQMPQQ